jgi:hypothetical protein
MLRFNKYSWVSEYDYSREKFTIRLNIEVWWGRKGVSGDMDVDVTDRVRWRTDGARQTEFAHRKKVLSNPVLSSCGLISSPCLTF